MTPKVFISYSHDTQSHKDWVEALAIRLRRSGVDATLDQWDATPGDDLTLFMERGVKESDRVIVVCTPNYVTKADAGIGGVGYERMIVTAELVRNVGTNKFIPILRNPIPERRVPTFLATKVFVDFSDGQNDDDAFDTLLRELHKVPPKGKPAIGANPFALSPLGQETPPQQSEIAEVERVQAEGVKTIGATESEQDQQISATALAAYSASRALIVAGEDLRWQKLSRQIASQCTNELLQWRQQSENVHLNDKEQAKALLDAAIERIAPLFNFCLAAVESGRQAYGDQFGLLLDLLGIRGWPNSGRTWFVNLPTSLVFVFHHLHGALCAYTGQFNVGLVLAERKVQSYGVGEFRRLCQSHELLGWPNALESDSLHGWTYLFTAPSRWNWLEGIFQQADSYSESLIAYRMLLNIHELVLMLAKGISVNNLNSEQTGLDVPLNFALEDREVNRRAFQLLLQHRDRIASIWETRNVPREKVEAAWPKWMEVCNYWVGRSSRAMFFRGELAHSALFDAL